MHEVRNEFSDTQVVSEILEGNVDAFEVLMDRYQGYVSGIATKHVPRERVREVAHETFVRAFRSLGTFRAKTPFKHWLARIAVRCCYDFWREHYKNRDTPVGAMSENDREWARGLLLDGPRESSARHARNQEALRVLRWAMDRLTAEDRMILTLIHIEEYTLAEAAELLRWSVAKVKIRAYRARRKLRKTLSSTIPAG